MVGDGGEIERSREARPAGRCLVRVGDGNLLAAGEVISVARRRLRAVDGRVGGEARMHVQIAEQRLAQRIETVARLARLGPLPGGGEISAAGWRRRGRGTVTAAREA